MSEKEAIGAEVAVTGLSASVAPEGKVDVTVETVTTEWVEVRPPDVTTELLGRVVV